MRKKLIFVLGPTASGKTNVAIAIAQQLGCDILSADSRQVYKEMHIGTARPEPWQLGAARHHFIGHISVHDAYTAGRFANEARAFIESYFKTNDALIVCGGTGLYTKALLEGMNRPPVAEMYRAQVRDLYQQHGVQGLIHALQQADPELAAQTEPHNPHRLMRKLEWVLAGKPVAPLYELPENWAILKIGLDVERERLYDKINQRVDAMMQAGLWEEAEGLFPFRELNALQTVGYQEIFEALEGKATQAEAISKIKQHTRNYAKRQLTWFKKDLEIRWFSPDDQAGILSAVFAFSQGI